MISVSDAEVGEIWVSGASRCLGYWDRAEATRETFEARIEGPGERDPRDWLRTGDMGFFHQGELYVCGRRKDVLIVRGQNHYPHDIEIVVEQATGVRKSGVAVVDGGEDGDTEIVVLAETASPRAAPDAAGIASAVRARLNLEVGRIVFIAPKSLPKTSSGKLMRYRAKQMWLAGELSVVGEYAPSRANDDAQLEEADGPFGFFRAKYRLTGEEAHTLIDAGLDSMDLVLFLHEVSELLAEKGARDLADQVDIRLIQQMSVRELFRLAARFEEAPETALAQVRRSITSVDEARRAEDEAMMRADRRLAFDPPRPALVPPGRAREILLTGATGFLGPFLLTSLLEQTDATIHCLVRGETTVRAAERLRSAMAETSKRDAAFWRVFERRVRPVRGDLDVPGMGLDPATWTSLADRIDTVYHNGAMVNYLFGYKRMRAANVVGTNEVLRFAFDGRPKVFNYVSTTFIYGWASKDVLYETDHNENMELLDFGYSQSKWVAEQVVADAGRRGLATRIFRPALITPAINGDGANFDITLRLIAFMIKYGIGVDALNQVSFVPVDVTANKHRGDLQSRRDRGRRLPRYARRLRQHGGRDPDHHAADGANVRAVRPALVRARGDQTLHARGSAVPAARLPGRLGRQHLGDGVQALRQFVLPGRPGGQRVGHG